MGDGGSMNTDDELDKILGIELKDKGTKVLKLIDVNQAKQAIKAYTEGQVQEVLNTYVNLHYDGIKAQLKGDK
jgi:hypothetical protein